MLCEASLDSAISMQYLFRIALLEKWSDGAVEYCQNDVTMKLVFPITPFLHRSNTPMSILNRNYVV